MKPKFPVAVTVENVIRALESLGFQVVRNRN